MKIADSEQILPIMKSFFLCLFLFWIQATSHAQEIKWLTDLNAGIAKAESEKKLVLIHFTASWSNPCREIDNFVFTSRNVERAISTNVVPVRIDVDHFPELAAEYGIAKVPYDIMITPGKRIVYRRHSPNDSANYALMIQRLERTIQSIAKDGMSTINQNLDDLKQLSEASPTPVVENPGFVPSSPNHQAPKPSENSQEMNRKFGHAQKGLASDYSSDQSLSKQQRVGNPFVSTSPDKQANRTPGPLKILNEKFFASEPNGTTVSRTDTQTAASTKTSSDPAGLVASTMQPNLQKTPETSLSGDFSSSGNLASKPPRELAGSVGQSETEKQSTNSTDFALKGKCPVALIQQGKWVAGDQRWGCIHRGLTYTFASEENLKTFQADPDAYSPLLSGYDPVIYATNGQLDFGKEEHGVFMGKAPNLRVVLFRDASTRKEFESNPKKYIQSIRVAMENSGGSSSQIR